MSTPLKLSGKMTVIQIEKPEDIFDHLDKTCKVAKADVQQLKSVRDDLANKFKENDKLLQVAMLRPTRQRLQRKVSKLTNQITAINRLIKYLETLIK